MPAPRALLAALAIALVAACHSDTPAPAHPGGGSEPAPPHRAGPAPSVAWGSAGFELHGLPAIANAGEVVVLPVTSPQVGPPHLRLEVRGADDHVVSGLDLLSADEGAAAIAAGGPPAALPARIAAANENLAMQHGVHDLRPMHALAVEAGHDGEAPHWATGDNLDVEWREHHLRVFRHNSTQPIGDVDGARWTTAASAAGCGAIFLTGVYHAAPGTTGAVAGNALVVTFGVPETNACAAAPPLVHVVSWPPAR